MEVITQWSAPKVVRFSEYQWCQNGEEWDGQVMQDVRRNHRGVQKFWLERLNEKDQWAEPGLDINMDV